MTSFQDSIDDLNDFRDYVRVIHNACDGNPRAFRLPMKLAREYRWMIYFMSINDEAAMRDFLLLTFSSDWPLQNLTRQTLQAACPKQYQRFAALIELLVRE